MYIYIHIHTHIHIHIHIDVHIHVSATLFCTLSHEKVSLENLIPMMSAFEAFHLPHWFHVLASRRCFKHLSGLQATPLLKSPHLSDLRFGTLFFLHMTAHNPTSLDLPRYVPLLTILNTSRPICHLPACSQQSVSACEHVLLIHS